MTSPLSRSFRRLSLPLACAALFAASAGAQDARSVSDSIEALVNAYHDADLFDGSVLVAEGDRVLYRGAFGLASVEWGVPNAPDTRFRIASVTKQFTAALVLQLVEEGLVDLQAPITTYVPAYPVEPGDRVTVHHLLTHTSGIPNFTGLPGYEALRYESVLPDSMLTLFQDEPLDFEPGEQWNYSNSGYILLGVLIEKVTGQTYAEVLQARIFEPLGMTDAAVYQDGDEVFERGATGYVHVEGEPRHAPYIDPSTPYAAGAMISTVGDLRTWSDALREGRVFRSPETFSLMTAPHVDMSRRHPLFGPVHYGYGVAVGQAVVGDQTVRMVGHDGGIYGFNSDLRWLPERDAVIVAISNTSTPPDAMVYGIAAILYGEAADIPKPSSTRSVRAALAEGGAEAAEAAFRAARADDTFNVTEDDLNTLGYEALSGGEVETAIRLFQLNTDAYPESWNVHDSLGEALAAAGHRDEAISAYERSLALNPDNTNGREVLGRLRSE